MTSPDVICRVAASQLGYDRFKDSLNGSIYGRWYAELIGKPEYAANGVPYCAMFTSWVLASAGIGQANQHLIGAYCPSILNAARARGQVLTNKKQAQAGDLVLFDWGHDGLADHVGIVEKNYGSYVQTIEGNTSLNGSQDDGGKVLRRTRKWTSVAAVVRPIYEQDKQTSETTTKIEEDIDMICAFQPNGENRFVFYDGHTCHDLHHEHELEAIKIVYRRTTGKELPMFNLGSESEPWATRFMDAVSHRSFHNPLIDYDYELGQAMKRLGYTPEIEREVKRIGAESGTQNDAPTTTQNEE